MKTCKHENCGFRVFSKGFCKFHWQVNFGRPIKKVSTILKTKLSEYSIVRKKFLKDNPKCQAGVICKGKSEATDIHHMKGRIGSNLTDTKYFLSVCREDHQWIEVNPEQAKEMGFSISRLT